MVASDVGVFQIEHGEEFDELIDGSESHSAEYSDGDGANRGVKFSPEAMKDTGAESLPAEPRSNAEPETMDDMIVFQRVFDQPPRVEDFIGTSKRPTLWKWHHSAGEMNESPKSEAPLKTTRKSYSFLDKGNHDDEEEEKRDVEFEEFRVFLDRGCGDRRDDVAGNKENDGAGDAGALVHWRKG